MEFYGFIHFTVNTFTDKEWGYGDEHPNVFAPSDFSAEQIVQSAANGGMKGLILTCKHHDGFCLWPSAYTRHSVKSSRWKNGRGDIVREISDACREQKIKFGVYLSPWDRNHPDYGKSAYVAYYRNQLRELLSNYGPVFEVWFDGANGGDGFYGGRRERRNIDRHSYYGWQETWEMVRRLQPQACMFSDAGPDIRWVGNEKGIAGEPCWHTMSGLERMAPGVADQKILLTGVFPGTHWLPAECDVSIRPGWFYHAAEDGKVRTPENLLDLYFKSIGRGAALLLNLPPDRRGRIHERDCESLAHFSRMRDKLFAGDRAAGAKVSASSARADDPAYGPANVIDGNPETYWCPEEGCGSPALTVTFRKPERVGTVEIVEYIALGQRIESFVIEARQEGLWRKFASGTSIGARRLVEAPAITADAIRLSITQSRAVPLISKIGVYDARELPPQSAQAPA